MVVRLFCFCHLKLKGLNTNQSNWEYVPTLISMMKGEDMFSKRVSILQMIGKNSLPGGVGTVALLLVAVTGSVKNPAASGGAFKDYSNRFNCESPAFSVR